MKATYKQIVSSIESLGKLSKKELPMREAIALARLIKKLNGELEVFNDKQRELFKKYGTEDESGGFKIEKECQADFSKEFDELLNVEIDIDAEKAVIEKEIDVEAAIIIDTENFVEFKTVK